MIIIVIMMMMVVYFIIPIIIIITTTTTTAAIGLITSILKIITLTSIFNTGYTYCGFFKFD